MIYGSKTLLGGTPTSSNAKWRHSTDAISAYGEIYKIKFVTTRSGDPVFSTSYLKDGRAHPLNGYHVQIDAPGEYELDVNWTTEPGDIVGVRGDGIPLISGEWLEVWQSTAFVKPVALKNLKKGPAVQFLWRPLERPAAQVQRQVIKPEFFECDVLMQSSVGQSNVSTPDAPRITHGRIFGSMGFENRSSALTPVENLDTPEHSGYGSAEFFFDRMRESGQGSNYDDQSPFIIAPSGKGGAQLFEMMKGNDEHGTYAAALAQVQAVVDEYGAENVNHIATTFFHGESEARENSDPLTYKSQIKTIRQTLSDDINLLLGTPNTDRKLVISQLGFTRDDGTWANDAAYATAAIQCEAARECRHIIMSAPGYILRTPVGEEVHADSPSQSLAGAYAQRATMQHHFEPLWYVRYEMDGDRLIVIYNRPKLGISDYTFRRKNYGFRAYDAGSELDILDVDIDQNRVVLKVGSGLLGVRPEYGNTQAVGLEPAAPMGGNLFAPAIYNDAFRGRTMDDYAVLQNSVIL